MVEISQSSTHRYYAIEVPLKSKHVWINEVFDVETYYHVMADYETCFIFQDKDPEYLGVIGGNETLPEEVAKEIIEGNNGGYNDTMWMNYGVPGRSFAPFTCQTTKSSVITLIESKGILVENPMEKPEPNMIFSTAEGEYIRQHQDWQSYESKLSKAVIIKVKK